MRRKDGFMSKMKPFQTRTDIIQYARAHINSRACEQAFGHEVELLGGFDPVVPSKFPGWIMRVVSRFGRTWHIAVTIDDHAPPRYRVWFVDEVPWATWRGKIRTPPSPIYDGDHPKRYLLLQQLEDANADRTGPRFDPFVKGFQDSRKGNGPTM